MAVSVFADQLPDTESVNTSGIYSRRVKILSQPCENHVCALYTLKDQVVKLDLTFPKKASEMAESENQTTFAEQVPFDSLNTTTVGERTPNISSLGSWITTKKNSQRNMKHTLTDVAVHRRSRVFATVDCRGNVRVFRDDSEDSIPDTMMDDSDLTMTNKESHSSSSSMSGGVMKTRKKRVLSESQSTEIDGPTSSQSSCKKIKTSSSKSSATTIATDAPHPIKPLIASESRPLRYRSHCTLDINPTGQTGSQSLRTAVTSGCLLSGMKRVSVMEFGHRSMLATSDHGVCVWSTDLCEQPHCVKWLSDTVLGVAEGHTLSIWDTRAPVKKDSLLATVDSMRSDVLSVDSFQRNPGSLIDSDVSFLSWNEKVIHSLDPRKWQVRQSIRTPAKYEINWVRKSRVKSQLFYVMGLDNDFLIVDPSKGQHSGLGGVKSSDWCFRGDSKWVGADHARCLNDGKECVIAVTESARVYCLNGLI